MDALETFTNPNSDYQWIVEDLGLIGYEEALTYQEQLWNEVKNGGDHRLLLLEHNPVITLGRRTDPKHILKDKKELAKEGIDLFRVERGGSATYHGPGQLVGYIICKSSRLGGIHELVSRVLKSIENSIKQLGIGCQIDEENPGLWTPTDPPRKLAAVGMQNKMGYTMHGFAVNVDMPLTGFSMIVPCGLSLPVSTLSIEKEQNISVSEYKKIIFPELEKQLNLNNKLRRF